MKLTYRIRENSIILSDSEGMCYGKFVVIKGIGWVFDPSEDRLLDSDELREIADVLDDISRD